MYCQKRGFFGKLYQFRFSNRCRLRGKGIVYTDAVGGVKAVKIPFFSGQFINFRCGFALA